MTTHPGNTRHLEPGIRMTPCLPPRRMIERFACIAVAASATILPACASNRTPGVPGLEEPLQISESPPDTANYRFAFSVHAVRRFRVPGVVSYRIENYERDIVGLISISGTRVLEVQTSERLLEGAEPCRVDIGDQLEDRDSEFEVRCADVRLKLQQVNGEIVDGTGFAWVLTDQGSEACIDPNSRRVCLWEQRRGQSPAITDFAWRSGPLRIERVPAPGGTLD